MVSEPEEEDEEDEDVIPGQEAATFEWKVIKEEEIRPIKG